MCSSCDLFGTYRRKCTGAPYVRLHGTWNKCGSDTRSCCESVQTRRIPCNTLGNSRILSHVRKSHSKRTPFFELNFPFRMLFLLQRPLQTPLMRLKRTPPSLRTAEGKTSRPSPTLQPRRPHHSRVGLRHADCRHRSRRSGCRIRHKP
jgi:hypothetical protein